MEKSRVICSLLKFFCDGQNVNPSSRTDSSILWISVNLPLSLSRNGQDYPELKCILPPPPILAYRCNRNLDWSIHLTNRTSYTAGGKCNTKYTIYAAECTKHNLLYIGQSSQKLNCRFNGQSKA